MFEFSCMIGDPGNANHGSSARSANELPLVPVMSLDLRTDIAEKFIDAYHVTDERSFVVYVG